MNTLSPAARWFGDHFATLHPLLRELHAGQGVLEGEAQVATGRGIAGRIGARLARRIGLPATGRCKLRITVSHDAEAMRWSRRFDFAGHTPAIIASTFRPVGTWPHGYWEERTGALRFRLTVDTGQGAWRWRLLGVRWHSLPLPLIMLPGAHAGKWIEGDAYRFEVRFELPLLGTVLSYGGALQRVAPETPADSPRPESDAAGSAA